MPYQTVNQQGVNQQTVNQNIKQIPVQFPTYQGNTLQPSQYGWQDPNNPNLTFDPSGRANQVSATGYDPLTSGGLSRTGSLVGTVWDNNPNMAGLNNLLLNKNMDRIANMGVTTALAVPVNQPVGNKNTPAPGGGTIPYVPPTYQPPTILGPTTNTLPGSTPNSGNTPATVGGGTSSINQATTPYNSSDALLKYLMMMQGNQDPTTMPGQQVTNNPMDWYNTSFANY